LRSSTTGSCMAKRNHTPFGSTSVLWTSVWNSST
jgi:hypothetical protein